MPDFDRQTVVSTIKKAWSEVFATQNLLEDANFFSLGGDSVLLTITALQIEEELGCIIEPELIYEAPTIGEFADAICNQSQ